MEEDYDAVKKTEAIKESVMDIREAVGLAKEGKEEGFQYLYQETYQKSYYVALKYMKQEDAALDVLQDAYVKAFKSMEQLQDAEKFPAWFARVVATTALDELKKKKVILFSQMETEEDFAIEDSFEDDRIDSQPELSYDQAETSRLVKEMIDTLSDEQRMCIMMFYVEELSVKEIAQTLGVSENTVKSRLNYGRKNIKEKVLELEKKGTKLYAIAPIPFFLYLLRQDSLAAPATQIPLSTILESQSVSVGKGVAIKAGKAVGTFTVKKAVIGAVIGVAVCGGAVTMIFNTKAQNKEEQKTVSEVQPEEKTEEKKKVPEQEGKEVVEEREVETAEEEPVSDNWKAAYSAFADNSQEQGNGYAILEVEGSKTPIMVVVPNQYQMLDMDAQSKGETPEDMVNMPILSPLSLELYCYDEQSAEVKQITNPDGTQVEKEAEFTYLPKKKLVVIDLSNVTGNNAQPQAYAIDVANGTLKAVNANTDLVTEDGMNRINIFYFRYIQEAMENIGAGQ